jgi:hypothetical protein
MRNIFSSVGQKEIMRNIFFSVEQNEIMRNIFFSVGLTMAFTNPYQQSATFDFEKSTQGTAFFLTIPVSFLIKKFF